jgi:hypothetical protein
MNWRPFIKPLVPANPRRPRLKRSVTRCREIAADVSTVTAKGKQAATYLRR